MKNALEWLCLLVALLPPLTLYAGVPSKDLVHETQFLLMAKGLNPGPLDGIYGEHTADAIRLYEAQHNLPLTGQVTTQLTEKLRDERQTESRHSNDSEPDGNNKAKQETTDKLNRKIEAVARALKHSESHFEILDTSVNSSLVLIKREIREHFFQLILFIITLLLALLSLGVAIGAFFGVPKLIGRITTKLKKSHRELIKHSENLIQARVLADFSAHCINLYKDFDQSIPKQKKMYESYLDIALNLATLSYEKAEKLEQGKTPLSDEDREVIDACINNKIYYLAERGKDEDKKVAQKLLGRFEKITSDYVVSLKDEWWAVKETLTWVTLKLGHKPISEAVVSANTLLANSTLPLSWRNDTYKKYYEHLMPDGSKLSDKFAITKPT